MSSESYRQAWLKDPKGGAEAFAGQGQGIREHDPSCDSLADVWLPRVGGRSCPGDLTNCQGCDLVFYNEGVVSLFEKCQVSNHFYCACCAKTATHPEGDCEEQ